MRQQAMIPLGIIVVGLAVGLIIRDIITLVER